MQPYVADRDKLTSISGILYCMETNIISKYFSLDKCVALVTGSSRGLGVVFATGLAEAGATVVLNGRDAGRLDSTRTSLAEKGLNVDAEVFDASDEASVSAGVRAVRQRHGRIDILVNNAGIQHRTPLEDFALTDWERLVTSNLTGPFLVAREVVRGMIEQRAGKIVNICSLQSTLGRKTIAPYAATKGGLAMLTRAMCVEWAAHNIQINAIGPGYFATEMTKPLREDEKFNSWLLNRTPANRWGDPRELLPALLLLAGPGSSFINGQILYVDGGITAAI